VGNNVFPEVFGETPNTAREMALADVIAVQFRNRFAFPGAFA
jgi:hypothetical protein